MQIWNRRIGYGTHIGIPHLKGSIQFQKGVECGQVEVMDVFPIAGDRGPLNVLPSES